MAKSCTNHAEAAAVTMCTQCHKPICQSCTMVTPAGRFCSSECSILYKEMKTKLGAGEGRKRGGFGLTLIFFVLLLVAGAFGVHFAARAKQDEPDHWLKKIDVIGRWLDQGKK
ncbi:MAG: hypothetical protein HYY16_13680 [Planctomycetes bacterium]|nr:hypothetical protein [Planctomycetota bacterium]